MNSKTINLIECNGKAIAEVVSNAPIITKVQDALDIMADSTYMGASGIILYGKSIQPEFFDLKTGMAGEILQKFSTYRVKLAIVDDFTNVQSRSLRDFIYESNKHGHVNFVGSTCEAIERLSKS